MWSILNWRILREEESAASTRRWQQYQCHHPPQLAGLRAAPVVRGLIVAGTGDTEYDALYDLLACRFIIPIGAAWPLRILSFSS